MVERASRETKLVKNLSGEPFNITTRIAVLNVVAWVLLL